MNVFVDDIEEVHRFLEKIESDSEKIDIINKQIHTTKKLIRELSKEQIINWKGIDKGWECYSGDKTLTNLIEDIVETRRTIFGAIITENDLKEITGKLKDRLVLFYKLLKNDLEFINRKIEIAKITRDVI